MSDEIKKHHLERENGSPHKSRHKRIREESTEKEILDKRKELFPAISLAMNMMKLSQMSQEKEESEEIRSIREDNQSDPDRNHLREKLQEKLEELLEEQQALIDLYVKAAKAAKEKEEEYKERISELIEQTERDRQLMKIFQSV